ncbi:hypothetical protein AB205_0062330 [Aquarana catesbeiana]|uniref:MIT domain-containing protein n=1 Tax=Aquarana catesbeiana TaxID=8400 RepID=A0A2G9RP89_AQUCT|nr:hypothetical protein AB205_0062330 [Aquarana catesbeiana]
MYARIIFRPGSGAASLEFRELGGGFRVFVIDPPAVMASPAGDGSLKPLQRAMKLANRAIKLDTGNRHREAYVEYLKSVSFISQFLADEAEQKGGELLNSDSHKMLKVADQCLERARTTAGKLGESIYANNPRLHH